MNNLQRFSMKKNDKLELLKDILFTEEKETAKNLSSEVERLKSILETPDKLDQKISPLLQQKLDHYSKTELAPLVVKSLKKEIKNSQDAVVEALYPIIGKMIKKYIANEIELLNERLNKQIQKAFSFKFFFKSIFRKKHATNQIIVEATKPELLHILVIEKESGILIAKHSNKAKNSKIIDEDMIAGMLTAIKSFVEDAFQTGNQNLETINYELYTLHIQDFFKFYITAVITGPYTNETKNILEDKILDFAQNGISKEDLSNSEIFTDRLKTYFTNEII